MNKKLSILLLPLLLVASLQAADQTKNGAEVKLREALRNTMLQLRDAETARATLQATQTESEQKIQTLTAQIENLTKQREDDKAEADKAVAELKALLAGRETQIAQLGQSVKKLEDDYQKASELACTKEAQRAKLASEVILLQRRVADQQTKNTAMFNIGNEILTRYEKFSLGDALTAREPFIGTTRVKIENLVQDYADKLTDQKIKPQEAAPNKKQ